MGKLITYGIIALIVLAVVFFGLKYPGKFIDITGAAIGWTKDKVGDLLDKTELDEKVTDKIEEKTSDAAETVVNKIKTEGITALSDGSMQITLPDENGVNQTYTCVQNGA